MQFTTLKLWKGIFNEPSIGGPSTLSNDPTNEAINLLEGNLILADDAGGPAWTPSFPTVKNGGVWSDSAAIPGRRLLLGRESNVQETMTLVLTAPPGPTRAAILSKLFHWARIAREYWQDEVPDTQVYLEMTGANAPGPQYAVIYNIDISADSDVYASVNAPRITLVLEREFAWRTVPPGNAYYGTRWPAISVTKSDLSAYDERGTTSVNYIDIPATSVPGDMPADVLITYNRSSGSLPTAIPVYHIARSTRQDRNPSNNSVGGGGSYSLGTPRRRNTINGGDMAVSGSWALVVTANGLRSNGSTVNRYMARHNTAVAATEEELTVTLLANQWNSRYAVYVRAQWTGAGGAGMKLSAAGSPTGTTDYFARTPEVAISSAYATNYLGVLDFTRAGSVVRDVNSFASGQSGFSFSLILNKPAAAALDLYIQDVVLIPIDEPNAVITPLTYSAWINVGAVALDTANVFAGPEREFIARLSNPLSDGGAPHHYLGNKITLLPNIQNRLYILPYLPAEHATGVYTITVQVYPRWAGLRSV